MRGPGHRYTADVATHDTRFGCVVATSAGEAMSGKDPHPHPRPLGYWPSGRLTGADPGLASTAGAHDATREP